MRLGYGYSETVRAALTRAAVRHGVPNLVTQLAAMTGMAVMGARENPRWYGTWFLIAAVVFAIRVLVGLRLSAAAARDTPVRRLEQLQYGPLVLVLASAGLWAALAWQRLLIEPGTLQFSILIVLSALCGGAVGVLAPLRWVGPAYITLMLVPASVRLMFPGSPQPVLGVLGLFFWIVMLIAHRSNHQLLVRSISLGEEKARLADALASRTAEIEAANEELESRVASRTEQLSEMAERAQAASRAKSEFLATISHEIRTPLNGVIGMAQVMAYGPLPAVQREQLGVIQSSANALLTILNDVLDIARIESGRVAVRLEAFDLRTFAHGLERTYAPLARDKGLSFTVALHETAEPLRTGDVQKLRQIASNLVANAIKFTEHGQVGLEISANGDAVQLSVWDTGAGIPEDMAEAVFERFVQVDGSLVRKVGGTGLGLAICRELAILLGGAIDLQSEMGRGSRFRVCLPMPPADALQITAPPAASLVTDLGSPRVLVVDDNPTNRLVLQALLQQFGIACGSAVNGIEALTAWDTEEWDAILMDVHMPGMDGLQATRAIRSAETTQGRRRTPILAVTASIMAHEAQSYMDAGMDGLVRKPIELPALVEALGRHLSAPAAVARSEQAGAAPLASTALSL